MRNAALLFVVLLTVCGCASKKPDPSVPGAETVRAQVGEVEPDPPGMKSILIDTTASLPEQLARLYYSLAEASS